MLPRNNVAILYTEEKSYPPHELPFWFRPSERFDDVIYGELGANSLYGAVKELLHLYHMDDNHYGTEFWNPFREIIRPGEYVLIKPNLVMDHNKNSLGGTDCLYTQPAVVVPIIDYVVKALEGSGKIIIGDAPMQECDFEKLIQESGYGEIIEYYVDKGIDIEIIDFRGLKTKKTGMIRHQKICESATGTVVDLADKSCFSSLDEQSLGNLRITNYAPGRLKEHHSVGKHEYYVSDCALRADVIINFSKPKTHRKAGYTAAMKNMVGVNVRKEYLPHHTIGSKEENGDEYLRKSCIRKFTDKLFDKKNTLEGDGKYMAATFFLFLAGGLRVISEHFYSDEAEGNWYGNETISKTIVDLNKIILYADKKGVMQSSMQRKYLNIGDMIVAGEKEGPVMPSPRPLGVLAIGENSYCFDVVVGTMMGADIARIPQLVEAMKCSEEDYPITCDNIIIRSNNMNIDKKSPKEIRGGDKWRFEPSNGWREVF